jgi:hypothetical protein
MSEMIERLLDGAVDTHVHTAPDAVPRKLNDFQLAEGAARARMAAIILKSHHTPTSARAVMANDAVRDTRVFGGVALNIPCTGGLNADAVIANARIGARIVWMPTVSATNHQRFLAAKPDTQIGRLGKGYSARSISLLGPDAVPVEELRAVLAAIAEHDLVLATGHFDRDEQFFLVREAKAAGVTRIVVNHPELAMTRLNLKDQKALADEGVYLERCIRCFTKDGHKSSCRQLVPDIRAVGYDSTILATDYGVPNIPDPVEGLADFAEELHAGGLSERELRIMMQDNPRRLLGIA